MTTARKPLLTDIQAAEFLGLTVGTLRDWRLTKTQGPPWFKLGDGPKAPVRYDEGDLLKWLAACKVKVG